MAIKELGWENSKPETAADTRRDRAIMIRREICRKAFETWAQEGTKPLMYPLLMCAGGEYVSPFTEHAWRAFKAGWKAND